MKSSASSHGAGNAANTTLMGRIPAPILLVLVFLSVLLYGVAQWAAVRGVWGPTGMAFHPEGHGGGRDRDPFLIYLGWQALAGGCQAFFTWHLLPAAYHRPIRFVLLLLWLFCTMVPLLGGVIIWFACVWAAYFSSARPSAQLRLISPPTFVSYLVQQVSHGGGARLQARVSNQAVPSGDRLSALVAIQQMPTRTTSSLLRDLLTDPLEDVRLIAYGRMDQAENAIMQQIYAARNQLSRVGSEEQLFALHRLLAELYFELAYQHIVQGAVQTHALLQADQHASAALALDDGDAALWLKRGRLALVQDEPEAAHEAFAHAQRLGFPRERLAPWLAEAAFVRGDFPSVYRYLSILRNTATLPAFKPVVDYWSA